MMNQRRSIRFFSSEPVPNELVETLVRTAGECGCQRPLPHLNLYGTGSVGVKACPHQDIVFGNDDSKLLEKISGKLFAYCFQTMYPDQTSVVRMPVIRVEVAAGASVLYLALLMIHYRKGKKKKEMSEEIFKKHPFMMTCFWGTEARETRNQTLNTS